MLLSLLINRFRNSFLRPRQLRKSSAVVRQSHEFASPIVEAYEERILLAAVSWDGGGGNLLWSNAQNWSGDQLPGPSDDVTVDAPAGAVVNYDANVTTVIRSLNLLDSIRISQGSLTVQQDLSSDSGVTLTVNGSSSHFNAASEDELLGLSVIVGAGGTALFPAVTQYRANNSTTATLRASGAGSVLNLSNVTNVDFSFAHSNALQIEAQAGGKVDLRRVTQISDETVNAARRADITADGAGSSVDLSALVNILDNSVWDTTWNSSLTVKNGGSITAPVLTTLKGVNVTLDGSGSLAIGNWINWTEGVATLSGGNYSFTALTNANQTAFTVNGGSLELPILTTLSNGSLTLSGGATANAPVLSNINGSSLLVNGGVTLSLPAVTNYVGTGGATATLRASGAGSVLNLSNVINVDFSFAHNNALQIEAQTGGKVDLRRVTQISDETVNAARRADITADGAGSSVDLSALVNFLDNSAWDTTWNSSLAVKNGGSASLGNQTSISSVLISMDSVSSIYGGTIIVRAGSQIQIDGDLWAGISNFGEIVATPSAAGSRIHGSYLQGPTGVLKMDLSGAVDSGDWSRLTIDGIATLAGTLELTRGGDFAPDLFSDFPMITGNSVTGTFQTVTGGSAAGGDIVPIYGSSVVALSRNFNRVPLDILTYSNLLPNQRTYFDVTQVTQSPVEFRLYDPAGKLVTLSNATPGSPNSGDLGPFLLKDVGTYELRVFAAPGDSPAYIYGLAPSPMVTQPGVFRRVITGEIAVPGGIQSWEFATRTGDEISLDVIAIVGATQKLAFKLQDPDGRTIFSRTAAAESFNNADFGPIVATKNGTYSLIVDGIGDDTASYQFLLSGPDAPRITSHALKGPNATTVNEAWFRFDQPMDASSFTLAQDLLTFRNQDGSLTATGFRWNDPTTLVITFATQPADVETPLFMGLSPNILNVSGVPLDQDQDRVPGEAVDDQYSATLSLDNRGPSVFLTEPRTMASAPIDRIIFYFSEAIDPATVTLADITTFTGPGGVNLINQITNLLVASTSVTVFFNEQSASGQYSISIGPNITDAAGNLMDQNGDGLFGQPNDAKTLTFSLLSANLVVDSVTNPVAATFGQTSTFTWDVRNTGNDAATGQWWDYVYLSADDKWDINDTVIGRRIYDSNTRGTLAGNGGTYTGTLTVPTPGMLPGDYRVIVRSNLLRSIPESNRSDNSQVSTAAARFDLPILQDAVSSSRPVNYRDALYYQINVPETARGGSVILRFGTNNTSVPNELYAKKDTLPTRAVYDQRSQQGLASNQHIILSNVQPGTYYVLAATAPDSARTDALGTATIHMEILVPGRFIVLDTYFGKGGTAGNRTIEVNGANFDRSITAKLTDGAGTSLAPVSYYRGTAEKLYATFDLRGVTPGAYNIVLENSAGQVMTFPNAMDVVSNTIADSFSPNITVPPAFRRAFSTPFVHFPAGISWVNNELNDIPTPIVIFSSNEPFTSNFSASISGTGANQEFTGTNSAAFFAYGNNGSGPPGILLPGERGSRNYEIVPRLASVAAREAASYAIDVLYAQTGAAFNWLAEKDRLSGSYFSQEEFDELFYLFQLQVGKTQGDYQLMLGRTAQLFPSLPEDVFEATELLTQEAYDRFAATQTASIIGQIDYNQFDIDFSRLQVVVTNRATLETFTAPVRLDGRFTVPNVGTGSFDLAVHGGAVAVGVTPIVVAEGAATDVSLQIFIGGSIKGSVLSSTGSPIAAASLVLTSESLDLSRAIGLAIDGTFEIADLSPGDYLLTATANGHVAGTTEITVEFGGNYKTSLTLATGTILTGIVRGPGNALVTNAQIRLSNALTGDTVSAFTGADGRYSFDGVPSGTWDALLSHPQYQDLSRTILVSGAGTSESFTLVAGAAVTGRIISTTGMPVAGAVVGVVTSGVLRSVVTGTNGLFTVAGLMPGDGQLQIDTAGFARVLQDIGTILSDSQTNLGDVTISAGISLVGQITDTVGSPLANAVVMLESNSGLVFTSFTTGTDGLATFTTLSPGVYRVSVAADGYASRTKLVNVSFDGQQIALPLALESTLSGTVAGASEGIVVLYLNGQLVRWSSIEADGTYNIDKLAAGDYVATVLHTSNLYQSAPIASLPGNSLRLDFSVAAGSLTGIVTNGSGQPVANATVVVSWVDPAAGDTILRSVQTAADGSYQMAGLSDGDITLTISADEYAQQSIRRTIFAGQTAVQNVSLQTGVRAYGSVRGLGNETISGATIYLVDTTIPGALPLTTTTAEAGSWAINHIVPGDYRALVLADGFMVHIGALTIAPDGSSPEVVLIEGGSSVSGTVSVDGELVANAAVTLTIDGIVIADTTTDADGNYLIRNLADRTYDIHVDSTGATSSVEVIALNGDTLFDVALATCDACQVPVRNVAALNSDPADSRSGAARITLPDLGLIDVRVQQARDRLAALDAEYNRVLSLPWRGIPKVFSDPAEPDCFCNSLTTKSRYNALIDWRRALILKSLLLEASKLEYQAREQLLRVPALQERYLASAGIELADTLADEIASIIASLGAVWVPPAGLPVWISSLVLQLLQQFPVIANHQNTYHSFIQAMERNKNQFHSEVDAFLKDVENYERELRLYERDQRKELAECDFPSGPSGSATVAKGEGKVVLLFTSADRAALAELSANGVTWYIEEVANPSGSGVSITPNGGAIVGDGDCETFTITLRLVIECDNSGLFGFGKEKLILPGRFTLTRTPIKVPFNVNCGVEKPDNTDCYKYVVTQSGDCNAYDPNDIQGPSGVGDQNWISSEGVYTYTIGFENDAEKASVPAAVVRVTQKLDSDLDFNTFRLGTIRFGNVLLSDAVGLSSFETRLDYRETLGIYLDIRAGIDLGTGDVFWELTSIDPLTGEVPFNPLIGFLPPNVNGVEGQGYLSYTISAKATVQTGDVIDAEATIYFDQNEAIVTPAIFNTIDVDAASSSVTALGATSFPGALVRWTGNDSNGSGVERFDVYVSQNNGPFELWLSQTTATEGRFFDAEIGSSYAFYSIAHDRVGNVELPPAIADTTTTIVEPPTTTVTGINVTTTNGVTVTIAFADDVVVADAIADGSIRDAVSLVNYQSGVLDLTNWVFTHSTSTRELQLSTTATLPSGVYEVQLDGEKFLTASGAILRGGHTGLTFGVPEFAAETQIQANSVPIVVTANSSPVLFDWNNDGRVDLIVGETLSTGNGQIRVYLNTGTTTNPVFGNSIIAQTNTGDLLIPVTGTGGITPRLADLSSDGDPDLVVGLPNGQIQYWLNIGTRTQPIFALPQVLQAGVAGSKTDISVGSAATVDVIDWDNNGTLDLVTGSLDGRVRVFLNSATSGSLDFGAAFVIQNGTGDLVVPTGRSSVSVVDLNYDGRKDLVLGNADGQALLYRNIGSDAQPRFDGFVPLTAGGAEINLAGFVRSQPYVADLNGDGRPDLVLGATDGKVRLFSSLDSTVPEVIPTIAGGEYSHAFELTLDSAAKTVPVLTGPIGSDITNPPLITWLPAIDAVSYHLFLRNLDSGTVISLLSLTDSEFRPSQLLSDGLYRVWVRAAKFDGFFTAWSKPFEFHIGIPRPVAPVLASPGTGSLGNRPTSTWNSVPNATTYDLWVDNLSSGQKQIIRQQSLTATSFTPGSDLPQGRYRAWVRASNTTGQSSWSHFVDFLVGEPEPSRTVITPPASLRTTVRPTIQWSATPRAASYELWFDNLTTGEKAVVHVFDITETSYSQSADLTEGVYRVWVRAWNLTGRGQWSSPITIAVGNIAPERSTLTGPVGLTSGVRPTISWTTSAGAESYLLWVNDLTRGQAKVILRNVTSTSFIPDTDLPTGEYRAWIQSQSEFGTGVWSRPLDFAVGPIKPGKAEIITPSGLRTASIPTLSWKPAAYAQTYEIWIDNRTTGAREFIHQTGLTGTQFTPAVGLADGIYRAWVRAGNTYGFGVWSSYIDFAVGSIAPDQVTIIRPTQAFQNPQPTLIWNIAAGADSYEVWINDLTRGIGEAIHTTVASNAFTPSSNLANGRYRVWIRAISSHGNGLWSTAVDFDVAVAGSLEDSLIDSLFEVDMVLTFLHDADLRSEDVEKRGDESHGEQIGTDVPANSSKDNDAASISAIVASTEMQLEGQHTASHGTELLALK